MRRLFYGLNSDDRLVITSNLGVLFAQFPSARPSVNREALREYFAATMSPWSGCTIWKGIRELRRGAVIVFDGDTAGLRGVRSHLTGNGADALFNKGGGGAPIHLAEWLSEGRYAAWARDLREYIRAGTFNAWHLLWHCSRGTLDLHSGHREPLPSWLTKRFQQEIREAERSFAEDVPRALGSDARERMYRFTQCFIPYYGPLPDERLPLVYRPLVEFVLGLDWVYMVRPNQDRVLMRRALVDILPRKCGADTARLHLARPFSTA